MNRHSFRWDGLAFGLFFLAALGQWAVWEQDLLEPDELAYVAAAVLIVLGLLGIVGTAISARSHRRTAPFTPPSTTAKLEDPDEDEPTIIDAAENDSASSDSTETTPTHGGNPA